MEKGEEGEGGEKEEFCDKKDGRVKEEGRKEAVEELMRVMGAKVELVEVRKLKSKKGEGKRDGMDEVGK